LRQCSSILSSGRFPLKADIPNRDGSRSPSREALFDHVIDSLVFRSRFVAPPLSLFLKTFVVLLFGFWVSLRSHRASTRVKRIAKSSRGMSFVGIWHSPFESRFPLSTHSGLNQPTADVCPPLGPIRELVTSGRANVTQNEETQGRRVRLDATSILFSFAESGPPGCSVVPAGLYKLPPALVIILRHSSQIWSACVAV
jgi:hypothetical protein